MSAHKLIKFTQALYSQPHLISQSGFNAVSQYLSNRNSATLMSFEEDDKEVPEETFDADSAIGVINISGALTYKPVMGMCGATGCSYESILEQAEELITDGAKTIVMNIDSGGGQGYGAFETADKLREMCDEAGIALYAYNDGYTASAAYVIAAVADEVVSNPYAETGSIGVLVALVNDSKHLEQLGYARSFITAGASKIPFAEDGSWREGFLEDIQTKVDKLYGSFISHVAKYTMMSEQSIRDTEAKMFTSEDALQLGLINSIKTRAEFAQYIINKTQGVSGA